MDMTAITTKGTTHHTGAAAGKLQAEADLGELKKQIDQLRRDLYAGNSTENTKREIRQSDLARICNPSKDTSAAGEKKTSISGVKTAAVAVAGFAAGYMTGEIHKNIELAEREKASSKGKTPITAELPTTVVRNDIVHKSRDRFERDNILIEEYKICNPRYNMIDTNKNGEADRYQKRSFGGRVEPPIIDDEPRLDIPVEKLKEFHDRNSERVSYAGYITADDIGEIGTHREKHDNGVITSFDSKTLSEVIKELHPREKNVNWAISDTGSSIIVYSSILRA